MTFENRKLSLRMKNIYKNDVFVYLDKMEYMCLYLDTTLPKQSHPFSSSQI